MTKVAHLRDVAAFERHDRSCKRSLRNALRANPSEVLIIGIDEDGDLFINAHPNDPGNTLWLMERAKQKLLNPKG